MIFFRKKDRMDVAWMREFTNILTMMEKKITTLEIEIDDIRMRLRKKSFFGKDEKPKDLKTAMLLPE